MLHATRAYDTRYGVVEATMRLARRRSTTSSGFIPFTSKQTMPAERFSSRGVYSWTRGMRASPSFICVLSSCVRAVIRAGPMFWWNRIACGNAQKCSNAWKPPGENHAARGAVAGSCSSSHDTYVYASHSAAATTSERLHPPDPKGHHGAQLFNVFNLDPFVWFVLVQLGFSGYGFSV